ncbi:MAG: UDP-N-acetylenolpyruvoylglucosamine reductase [Rhodobiaceae bacterium]|nr:UDP-N-acetylenolpyruvoylglucosamine reductase [Rhodobiaceae bacterium]|tara:strand:+ start:322 stop:1239 length:918 start_codon:yes stop_codon:yes gene_type:complete
MNKLIEKFDQSESNYGLKGKFFSNKSLKNISWFKVGGPAECLYIPSDQEDLSRFLKYTDKSEKINVFGRLSNVLIRDKGLTGLTILIPPSISEFNILKNNTIEVGSGMLDKDFSKIALENEIGGMEFLSGIPGNLGGAIAMNAGCYGKEIKDIFVEARVMNRDGKIISLKNDQMQFSYRNSIIRDDQIIIAGVFRGKKKSKKRITEEIKKVEFQKKNTQPSGVATGGSTFKNPKEVKAWELINSVGLSGFQLGGAMISPDHNNFFVNTGNASASDIEDLGNLVIEKVKNKHGVILEWEIRIIGDR